MDADFSQLNNDFEDVFCSQHQIQLRSPFRLLALPPELWLRICEFAVVKSVPIRVGKEPNFRDQVAITQQPAITRTCRLLRHESLPVFYALNTFEMLHCFGVPCPRKWIEAIGSAHRKRIKSMLMMSSCDLGFWEGSYRRASIDASIELVGSEPSPVALFPGYNKYKVSFN